MKFAKIFPVLLFLSSSLYALDIQGAGSGANVTVNVFTGSSPVNLADEGAFVSKGTTVNCVGAGITCTGAGDVMTLTVPGGGVGGSGSSPLAISTGSAQAANVTSSPTSVVNLSSAVFNTQPTGGSTSYISLRYGPFPVCSLTGSTRTLFCNVPDVKAYIDGQIFMVRSNTVTYTGPYNLNVNNLGDRVIFKKGGERYLAISSSTLPNPATDYGITPIHENDMQAGYLYSLQYDATSSSAVGRFILRDSSRMEWNSRTYIGNYHENNVTDNIALNVQWIESDNKPFVGISATPIWNLASNPNANAMAIYDSLGAVNPQGNNITVPFVTPYNALLYFTNDGFTGNKITNYRGYYAPSPVIFNSNGGSGSIDNVYQFIADDACGENITNCWIMKSGNGTMDLSAATGILLSSTTMLGDVNVTTSIRFNGSYGTNGQFLTSGGPNTIPTWTTAVAGGSGASSLAIATGSAVAANVVSSPTAIVNFSSDTFLTALKGGATAFVGINPVGNITVGTLTVGTATINTTLGIGTLPGAAPLSVQGNKLSQSAYTVKDAVVSVFDNTGNSNLVLGFVGASSAAPMIKTSGAGPRKLHLSAGVDNPGIGRMTIDTNGNIGIAESTPTSLLDVNGGSITVRGTNARVWIDGALTSSGSVNTASMTVMDSSYFYKAIHLHDNEGIGTNVVLEPKNGTIGGVIFSSGSSNLYELGNLNDLFLLYDVLHNSFPLSMTPEAGGDPFTMPEQVTPGNPAATTVKFYAKSGKLCSLDSSGSENCTGGTGGAGGGDNLGSGISTNPVILNYGFTASSGVVNSSFTVHGGVVMSSGALLANATVQADLIVGNGGDGTAYIESSVTIKATNSVGVTNGFSGGVSAATYTVNGASLFYSTSTNAQVSPKPFRLDGFEMCVGSVTAIAAAGSQVVTPSGSSAIYFPQITEVATDAESNQVNISAITATSFTIKNKSAINAKDVVWSCFCNH